MAATHFTSMAANRQAIAAQPPLPQMKASWDDAPLSVILFDPHATDVAIKIVDCNRRACEMHGYTRAEMIGQSDRSSSRAKQRGRKNAPKSAWTRLSFSHQTGNRLEGESQHRAQGRPRCFWIEYFTSLIVVDGREFVIGMDRDATARKQAELALSESQERWHLAVAGSNEGVWDWNIEATDAMWLSPRWKSMLGFFDDELPSRREVWMDRIHPDDRRHVETAFATHLMQNTQILHCEYRIVHTDGSWVWALPCAARLCSAPTATRAAWSAHTPTSPARRRPRRNCGRPRKPRKPPIAPRANSSPS